MQLLFTLTNEVSFEEATVSDSNFKQHYSAINDSFSWDTIHVELRKVTRDLLLPFYPLAAYDALLALAEPNAAQAQVLDLLRDAVAEYTIWRVARTSKVSLGNLGVNVPTGEKSTPPTSWEYAHFYWGVMRDADSHLDAALKIVADNRAAFPEYWDNVEQDRHALIRQTSVLQSFVNINSSRRTFMALLNSIRRAGLLEIMDVLGTAQWTELLDQLDDGTLSETNKALLSKCQEVVAHYAIWDALPSLSVLIESNAVVTVTSVEGMNTKQTAQLARVEALREQSEYNYKTALERLHGFLHSHKTDYPLWAATLPETDDNDYPLHFGDGAVFL